MIRNRLICWMVIAGVTAASPAFGQLRWFESYTGGLADSKIKQDKLLTTSLVITENLGPSRLCVEFSNTAPKPRKGKIIAVIMIFPVDEDVGLVAELKGKLQGNRFSDCVEMAYLIPGDVVSLEVQAKKFKRIRRGGFFSAGVIVAEKGLGESAVRRVATYRESSESRCEKLQRFKDVMSADWRFLPKPADRREKVVLVGGRGHQLTCEGSFDYSTRGVD